MTALVHHVLESTVFAAVAGLLALAFRRERAGIRHWLWMAASVKFLIPFAVLVALGSRVPWRAAPAAPEPELTFVMADLAQPAAPPRTVPAPPARSDWLPDALGTLWLGGAAAFLLRWRRRWKTTADCLREATPVRLVEGVRVLSGPSAPEPAVFGIFRPVLLLPAGIQQRLSPTEFEAVLAHELCHIRRRDNLAGTVHMLVESLFWFHPLVWWLGARLVEERELACDEEVLRRGAEPELYAESILKVCEFCFESALPCVSGITGADLDRRIRGIMAARLAPPLRRGRKLLLAFAAAAAVAGPVAIGLTHPTRMRAQAQPRTAEALHFEVASVKPVDQPWLQVYPQRSGDRITWTTDLRYIVEYAYHLKEWRVIGAIPGSAHIYAFDVKTAPNAPEEQVRLMFQSLLADRFKLAAHRETREAEGYALTVAKNGPRIQPVKGDEPPAPLPEWFHSVPAGDMGKMENKVVASIPRKGAVAITGRRATMLQLTESLQTVLRVSVLDQTGLSGNYYFGFEFARDDTDDDPVAPPLAAVIQKELGLKLEKHKGPVEFLVIDHIETAPTEN